MRTSRTLFGLLLTVAISASALAGYTGGGTFVVKAGDETVLDNGGAVCEGLSGSGVGGGCLPFPDPRDPTVKGGFVGVLDDVADAKVAFQVCIDNDGDGVCGGLQPADSRCRDQIFFSHADGEKFFNPLGPLPTSTLRECGNAFQGYIVLLCQGEHADAASGPHSHAVTQGKIFAATNGTGYGDFCGGGNSAGGNGGFVNATAKAYRVV